MTQLPQIARTYVAAVMAIGAALFAVCLPQVTFQRPVLFVALFVLAPMATSLFKRADIPTSAVQVDGIAELWFEDRASMERALASPQMAALHADGALFIGANKTFVVEEKTIIA